MTRITLDDSLIGALGTGASEAELIDSSGHRLGYYLSDEAYRRLVCQWANSQVSDQDIEANQNESESYTTVEVLERLRGL
jgi:hypothetical protein